MEHVMMAIQDRLSDLNAHVQTYATLQLRPLGEGNDLIARVLSASMEPAAYVNRTKRSFGISLWIVGKHEQTETLIESLYRIQAYAEAQGARIQQEVGYETTDANGLDVYSLIVQFPW